MGEPDQGFADALAPPDAMIRHSDNQIRRYLTGWYHPGTHFTNGFSIAIRTQRKFRFAPISLLSCHVQKIVAICWQVVVLQQGENLIEFDFRAESR